MDTDVTQTPSKKRRKGSLGKEILPLQDTKRSMIVLKEEDEEKWMDKELWLIQLPTNVYMVVTVSSILHKPRAIIR